MEMYRIVAVPRDSIGFKYSSRYKLLSFDEVARGMQCDDGLSEKNVDNLIYTGVWQ